MNRIVTLFVAVSWKFMRMHFLESLHFLELHAGLFIYLWELRAIAVMITLEINIINKYATHAATITIQGYHKAQEPTNTKAKDFHLYLNTAF